MRVSGTSWRCWASTATGSKTCAPQMGGWFFAAAIVTCASWLKCRQVIDPQSSSATLRRHLVPGPTLQSTDTLRWRTSRQWIRATQSFASTSTLSHHQPQPSPYSTAPFGVVVKALGTALDDYSLPISDSTMNLAREYKGLLNV